MKVHELAKQLKTSSKELVAFFTKHNVDVKNHLSKIDDAAIKLATSTFKPSETVKEKKPSTKKTTKKAVTKKEKPSEKKAVEGDEKPLQRGKRKGSPDKRAVSKKTTDDRTAALDTKKQGTGKKKVSAAGKRAVDISSQTKKERQAHDAPPKIEKTSRAPQKESARPRYTQSEQTSRPDQIEIKIPITVSALATNLMVKTSELIKTLIGMGVFATVNQPLGEDIVMAVAEKYNVIIDKLPSEEEKLIQEHDKEDTDDNLKSRWPVVTLMGHVDHGKTSLLDTIRKTNVADREAGKITQHIGAYEVALKDKGHVTFLDTPGHAAFTAMRARGANLTDIVVVVIAADDGVMPQTVEAIDHARAAGTPIVVAINKSDLPTANPDKVKAELQKHDIVCEEWGGSTIMVSVSAVTGDGIDELLELLLLEAEILELKANPDRSAQGTVIEGALSKQLGAVATILVQNGTLRPSDIVVCGEFYGKVRAMRNDKGKNIKAAGPSTPVEILGLNGVPSTGERFYVVGDEKQARVITEKRFLEVKEKSLAGSAKHLSLEGLYDMMREKGTKELKIVLKADVRGSVEVLKDSLEKLTNEKIKLRVIHAGVGGINESDVILAHASDAVIIGFHVKADSKAQALIDREKVDMKYYRIIYECINDIKMAMEGLLEPTIREVIVGTAEIRELFKASKIGTIAGCIVRKGKIVRNHHLRIIRDNIVIYEGKMSSLKRFKDDVREVQDGYECGIVLERFHDLKVGDLCECFTEEKVAVKM